MAESSEALSLHQNLVCHGTCRLSDPKFHDEIFQVAKMVAEEALNVKVSFDSSESSFGRIVLFDQHLACDNTTIWLNSDDRTNVPSVADLLSTLTSALKQRLLDKNDPKYGPEVHLLLWFAVFYGPDCDLLTEMLKNTEGTVPPCLLSSLLLVLCRKYHTSPLAVETLLRHGASPVERLSEDEKATHPFTACLNGLNVYLEQEQAAAEVVGHINVLKLFIDCYKKNGVEYGRFFAPDRTSEWWILQFLGLLAMYNPEMVISIIEAGAAYLNMEHHRHSPLSNCIFNLLIYLNDRTESYNLETATTMVVHAALPLLRAGSRIHRPVFTSVQGRAFWRFPSFIDFAVESYWHSVAFDPRLRVDEPSIDIIRQHYPRKLQFACRQAILAQLPQGLKRRKDAINSLQLPPPLQLFLNFPEFDTFSFQ